MENSYFMRPYGGYHDVKHGGMDDPRFQEYHRQHSSCSSEQQSVYSTRAVSGLPITVFVSGIHSETTDEGISNIFGLYGMPVRIFKSRNKNNEVIASVAFATEMEADSAIIGLDGKPPLYWKVGYSLDHSTCWRDPQYFDQYDAPMLPPQRAVQPSVVPFTRALVPFHNRGVQSLPNARRISNGFPSYPPCIICSIPAGSVCSKCKAPYCSVDCQYSDWYLHKNECVSPPALEPVNLTPLESASQVKKSLVKNEELVASLFSQSTNSSAQLNGHNSARPINQSSPKKNDWMNNLNNMKTPVLGSSRPGSFPMKKTSTKSLIASRPVAEISPPDSPIKKDIYAKTFTANKLSPLRNRPSQVVIRAAKNPDNFFIQYLNFKEMLDTLTNEIQLSARNAPPLMEPVLENSPCIGMCPLNGKWLRAKIVKVWDNAIGVFFVDYGYKVKLRNTPEQVRMMEYEFSQKPFFAIEAQLAEVVPLEGNDWPEEVKAKFKTLVEDREFTMEFVQSEQDLMMVRLTNGKGGDLASYLVNQKMANLSVALSALALPMSVPVQPEAPLPQPTIPTASLETGFTNDVIILAADDLDQIFIQPIKDENMASMASLQEALNKYFESSTTLTVIPPVGTYVASMFPDDNGFYRARVEAVRGDTVKVHYIDFGNSCEVTLAELRCLPHELFKFPIFTFKVSLASVSRPASNELPASVKSLLSSLVSQLGTVSVINSTDSSIDCFLIVDGIIVNQKVFELLKPVAATPAITQSLSIQSTAEEVQTTVETTEQKQVDIFRFVDGPFLDLPEGEVFQAMIFSVESPQMIMMCEGNDSILTKLDQLQNDLAVYASSVVLSHTPVEGEMCIVRSIEDEGWYRGACLQIISDGSTNSFEFILVDFGSIVTCSAEDVRRIPKRFVECLPYIAQHAILKGCENISEVSENLAKRVAELLPVNTIVEVKVENRADTSYIVDIPSVYSVLKAEGLL